jgi:demethylmenaquinone methyltransferase/2-methoxy-6-polyprenyl-1,4-benzoquinol methylase
MSTRDRQVVLDELRPDGDVLELGCGPGGFTRELAQHARTVTALDSSPMMLARNEEEVAQPNVRYVQADVFEWTPDATYDFVFFGFLLSHIPSQLFEPFWQLIRRSLKPEGRVGFVDEDNRVANYDEVRLADGVPVARRRLADGREFEIVKIFWEPRELEAALFDLGWSMTLKRVGDAYLYGTGHVARP